MPRAELAGSDAQFRMDRMYRYQRFIYDFTRKFYLIGRDNLLDSLPRDPGLTICELGCGTGRNLIRLARRSPLTRLYGIDVSAAMLATAENSIRRAGLQGRIRLARTGVAEFNPAASFGIERFDTVYFSYVLSMIPDWQPAVEHALALLRPGGTLAVVDFADQAVASPLRRRALLAWLRLFDVHPRPEIEHGLRAIARANDPNADDFSIGRGYAYRLTMRAQVPMVNA